MDYVLKEGMASLENPPTDPPYAKPCIFTTNLSTSLEFQQSKKRRSSLPSSPIPPLNKAVSDSSTIKVPRRSPNDRTTVNITCNGKRAKSAVIRNTNPLTLEEHLELGIAYTFFKINVAAMEAIKKVRNYYDIAVILYSMLCYKLGKNRVQRDVAMMYLAECITTLKNLPHTSISAVLITRAKNRLFVLRQSLMPVVKSFKRSAIVDFPQTACRFTKVVVSTVAKDIEYKENHSLYYHNFPLTSHPNTMSESNIWSKLKYAADLVSYQRYRSASSCAHITRYT